MNAATADPPVLDLPADLAAALDAAQQDPAAAGGVWVRHPRTGARFRLRREPGVGAPNEPEAEEAAGAAGVSDGYRSPKSLAESVRAGLADAAAGRSRTLEEARAEMERRHPELRGR